MATELILVAFYYSLLPIIYVNGHVNHIIRNNKDTRIKL